MSRRRKGKHKRRGHFCCACERYRANERFSGHGHARHVCRECSKLGSEELELRQALRNLERCVEGDGFVPRRRRKTFEQFLHHSNPRVRSRAEEMLAAMSIERALNRAAIDLDEVLLEAGAWCISLEADDEVGAVSDGGPALA